MTPYLLKPVTPAGLAKLKAAAKNYDCVLCGRHREYTVPAHSNALAHGRGVAKKTPDYFIAYLCGVCHDQVDGRAGGMSKEEKRAMWNEAYARTVGIWFRDGLIVVAL